MAMEMGKMLCEVCVVVTLLYIAFKDYRDFIVSNNSVLLLFIWEAGYLFFCGQELYLLLKPLGISMVIFGSIYCFSHGGMGAGDVKLAVVLSIWLGYPQILTVFFLSFILGGFAAVIHLVHYKMNCATERKDIKNKIAFAPMVVISSIAVHFFHHEIIYIWYVLIV